MKSFLMALLVAAGMTSLVAQAADPASVNGKPIKQSLVDYIVKEATAKGQQVDAQMRANILEKLIITELLDQEARKSGIDKQPEFKLKEEMTLSELRVNAYLADYISKNPVDDAAVQVEYDRLKSHFAGKEFKASHILVKTEAEAKALIDQLAKGADFARLAKENSLDSSKDEGGDLGWFSADSMVQPFAEAVVRLQKGGYTATPVQTEYGWHVIRLEDVRDFQPPSFDAVKAEIRDDLRRRKLEALVSDLKAKAKIVNDQAGSPAK